MVKDHGHNSVGRLPSLDDDIADAYGGPRMTAAGSLLAALTAVAIVLTGTTLVAGFIVRARRREIAIRMALGSYWRPVTRVVGHSLVPPAMLGVAAGCGLLLAARSIGFVGTAPPGRIGLVSTLMLAGILIAGGIPSIAALRRLSLSDILKSD